MLSSRSLLLSLLAPVAAFSLSGAGGVHLEGRSTGGLSTPFISGAGAIEARLTDSSGVVFQASCTLAPNLTGSSWAGYSPTGIVTGKLIAVPGSPTSVPIDVWGSYSVDARGAGDFNAYLTQGTGTSQALVGSFSGRFLKNNVIDPLILLPKLEPFLGEWELNL